MHVRYPAVGALSLRAGDATPSFITLNSRQIPFQHLKTSLILMSCGAFFK